MSSSSSDPEKAIDEKAVDEKTVDEKVIQSTGLENAIHIQRIVREGIILGGGATAILLQVAMPGVGKGVDNHSNFAYRPMDRLRTTMTYVYCMAFGSPKEKEAVIAMVHRAHSSVKGTDYSADDAQLQVWVAATLYAVGVELYEEIFGPMDEATAEQTYREYAVLAVSLRVQPDQWPATRQAFWTYWDQQIASVEVNDHAKHVAHDLLYNTGLPIHLRVLMPWVRLMTGEMLPARIREAYGIKTTKHRQRGYRWTMSLVRNTYPALPKFIRTYPKKYYLNDMRKRLRKAQMLN